MKRLARASAVTVTSLLALTLAAACTQQQDDAPRIPQYPAEGDGWSAMSLPHRRAGQPVIFDAIYLCLDRPGSVEITDVAMEHAEGGFTVEAFATRPAAPPAGVPYPQLASDTQTLWDLGYKQGNNTVDTACTQSMSDTPSDHRTQVGVQFSKPTSNTARGALLRITYQSGDRSYTYRLGLEAILCEAEESDPECQPWDYDWTKSPVRILNSTPNP